MQLQVQNSPFDQKQIELLNILLPMLTESQQMWLSGYLTALNGTAKAAVGVLDAPSSEGVKPASQPITVLYGSQTGNGQGLAEDMSRQLEEQGYEVTLSSMNDFKANRLKKIQYLLLIVSTHGEGDPPDNALPFYEFLNGRRAPKLEGLRYSVLALGDSSYEHFCQTGKEFDARLAELGAERLCPRKDCDVDFDEPAAEWFQDVLSSLRDQQGTSSVHMQAATPFLMTEEQTTYSRTNPFQAEVLENFNLNGRGSNKETRHLVLSLEGSNLQFEPGDSLGIYPENESALVDALIREMDWNPEQPVSLNKKGDECPLREALLNHFEITVLTKPLLMKVAQLCDHAELREMLEPEHEGRLKDYLHGRDLLDLIRDFSLPKVPANEFIPLLRKMPARLYSIASSLEANPDEVHLTIGTIRYHAHGRQRSGVCSGQCADRVQPGDTLPVYVQRNPNFKLPADPDTPLIMVGPGTGVAPFRSFLEEREEIGVGGKTWLFFGDQHYITDFLYQVEWQRWLKEGVLTRMDIAFSRDQEEKVYVQHRMREKGQELFQWLEEGAVVYVCGDEKNMAKDVHATLKTILEREGGMTPEEAASYLSEMQQQKRYQRDVY